MDYDDEKQPLDVRARSYLHSNCAHCHIKWGGGNAEFKLLATNSLGERITASPAVTGNWLIYRTDSHLDCIGKEAGK